MRVLVDRFLVVTMMALALGATTGCGGCGAASTGQDAGRDAGADGGGSITDAGGTFDAGASDAGTTSDAGGSTDSGLSQAFPPTSIIYQDISAAALDPNSTTLIANLADAGGWGTLSGLFQVDNSIAVVTAAPSVQSRAFTPDPSYYSPDCDMTPVPVPPGGNVEGSTDYSCDVANQDCHLLIYQGARLFELYKAQIDGGTATGSPFTTLCEVAWDLNQDYWQPGNPYSRGEQCSSADAAGLPVAPLLAMGAELQAASIKHALRFTLPQPRMYSQAYVHPATHATLAVGSPQMLPFGSRLRLRSTFPLGSLPNSNARTVAIALQHYGMFLADIGSVPLTVDASVTSTLLGSHDLQLLQVSDFEVVAAASAPILYNGGCTRTPLTQ